MTIISLEAYWDLLHSHDWFHEMSDDHNVFKRGEESYTRIRDVAAEAQKLGLPEYEQLYTQFQAHHYEHGPLPERPGSET